MDKGNKHALDVVFEGAADLALHVSYTDLQDMERGLEILPKLSIPSTYPHHPAWAMLGQMSGEFAKGVSTIHVSKASAAPHIVIPKGNVYGC